MERGKCKVCDRSILYLNTKAHIQFGGMSPPVQKDDMCPVCWVDTHPDEEMPKLPGWEYALREFDGKYPKGRRRKFFVQSQRAEEELRAELSAEAKLPGRQSGLQNRC